MIRARHPVFFSNAMAMAGIALACTLLALLDPRLIGTASVWAKPAKFAASFALWLATLAWLWPAMAPEARAGRLVRWGVPAMLVAAWGEMAWIGLRAAFGLPSHFAQTPLAAFMYGLMGVGATLLVLLLAGFGALMLWHRAPAVTDAWRRAAGLGLVLGGVLGGLAGWVISVNGSPFVGGQAGHWPPFYWSADGGDLRVAHFVGMHAMQIVPLAGWWLGRPGLLAAATVMPVLTAAAFWQALAGRAVLG